MCTPDDRLLRTWTPRILRGALAASACLLVAGLCVIAATAPHEYVANYRALEHARGAAAAGPTSDVVHELARLPGNALLVAGLLVLTFVPIARVAFAALVFLRARDWLFFALTSLVLALLGLGVILGRGG
jgi:uncharacterized membrane protein